METIEKDNIGESVALNNNQTKIIDREKMFGGFEIIDLIKNSISTIFFRVSPDGRFEVFGPNFERIFGYRIEEVSDWRRIVHPEELERVVIAHKELEEGKELDMVFRVQSKNDRVIWLHEKAAVKKKEQGEVLCYYGFVEDISREKEAEEARMVYLRRFNELNRIANEINRMLKLEDIITRIADSCRTCFGCRYVQIGLVDKEKRVLEVFHVSSADGTAVNISPGTDRGTIYDLKEMERHQNLIVKAINDAKIYRTDDLHELATPILSKTRCREIMEQFGLNHFLIIPMLGQQGVVAVLTLGAQNEFDELSTNIFSNLASQATFAINNARLLRKIVDDRAEWEITFRAIAEPVAIVKVDGEVMMANESFTLLDKNGSVQGKHCQDILQCRERSVDCKLAVVTKTKSSISCNVGELNDRHYESFLHPIIESGEVTKIVLHMRDMSLLIKTERYFERRYEELSFLSNVVRSITHSLRFDDVLQYAFKEILKIMQADVGAILVCDGDNMHLQFSRDLPGPVNRHLREFPASAFENFIDYLLDKGDMVVFSRTQHPVFFRPVFDKMNKIESIVTIPLVAKKGLIGAVMLMLKDQKRFDHDDKLFTSAISREVGIAIENARLHEETRESREMLKLLTMSLLRTEDDIRKRIARELHDQVGQALASAKLTLGLLQRNLRKDDNDYTNLVTDVERYIDESIKMSRNLIYDLFPAALEDIGLVAFLRSYCDTFRKTTRIDLRTTISIPSRLPNGMENLIFRLIQEGLSNMAKHSQARKGELIVETRSEGIGLSIRDDGKGFSMEGMKVKPGQSGVGLSIMRQRVESIGGQFVLSAKPRKGTSVEIAIPFKYAKKKGGKPS